MLAFRTFVLKVSSRCNIDCDYCYVFNLADQGWRDRPVHVGVDVAALTARRIAEHAVAHGLTEVHIVLHGGEPLLAGIDHVRSLLEVMTHELPRSVAVRFEVQTNGMLITNAWLDLFERFAVSVGVSLDGPPVHNDRHRLDRRGRSTAAAALRGIDLLRSRESLFGGILAVVDLANDPVAVHDFLAALEPPLIDFNLPHATHDRPPPRGRPESPEYGQWLVAVYDAWMSMGCFRHTVRMLEDIVALTFGVRGTVESLGLAWPALIVIESDGSIGNLDTLGSVAQGAAELGFNVFDNVFDEVALHPAMAVRRGDAGTFADECLGCSVLEICGGGYLPHRHSVARGYRNPSVYCRDLKYVIAHVRRSIFANEDERVVTGGGSDVDP